MTKHEAIGVLMAGIGSQLEVNIMERTCEDPFAEYLDGLDAIAMLLSEKVNLIDRERTMEREQLEQHQATLRGLRDSLAMDDRLADDAATLRDLKHLTGIVDSLAEVMLAFVDERLAAGAHGAAVRSMINEVGDNVTRTTLDEPLRMTLAEGSEVEQGGKLKPGELDPRD